MPPRLFLVNSREEKRRVELTLFHETWMLQHFLNTCIEWKKSRVRSRIIAQSISNPMSEEQVVRQHDLVTFLDWLTMVSTVAYKSYPLDCGDIFGLAPVESGCMTIT